MIYTRESGSAEEGTPWGRGCAGPHCLASRHAKTFLFLNPAHRQLSRMGGLTARVGQLLEDLPTDTGPAAGAPAGDMHAVRVSLDGRELQPSSFAALLQPPRQYRQGCLGTVMQPPTCLSLPIKCFTSV